MLLTEGSSPGYKSYTKLMPAEIAATSPIASHTSAIREACFDSAMRSSWSLSTESRLWP